MANPVIADALPDGASSRGFANSMRVRVSVDELTPSQMRLVIGRMAQEKPDAVGEAMNHALGLLRRLHRGPGEGADEESASEPEKSEQDTKDDTVSSTSAGAVSPPAPNTRKRNCDHLSSSSAPPQKESQLTSVVVSMLLRECDQNWQEKFSELEKCKEKHGSIREPGKAFSTAMEAWMASQKAQHKLYLEGKPSKLTSAHVALLNHLDPRWNEPSRAYAERWEKRFEELRQFKQDHGDTLIPYKYPENQQLSNWVQNQRKFGKMVKAGKKASITPERIEKLEKLGFDWGTLE